MEGFIKGIKKTEETITRLLTPKRLSLFLTAVYLLSLIPLLVIGHYNYPSADDYSNGVDCRQAWVATHSLFSVLAAGVTRTVRLWWEWMGYFTCNFITALAPNVFSERAYVITTWLSLCVLSLSTVYFLHTIFVKIGKADRHLSNCITMLLLFVTVQCMVGRTEAFYWFCGAANYIMIHSLCLIFYGLLLSAVFDSGKKRRFDLIMAAILGFLTGGGNQMSALNEAVVLLMAATVLLLQKKWKQQKALLIPMGCFYLSFLLNVAAPGNRVRADGAAGMNPVKAVFVSFYYCLDYCISKWSDWTVLLLIILLVPLFFKMAKKCNFSFPCPLLAVLLGYCLTAAMMTPPLFATGNIEAARVQALIYTMYLLNLTLCTGYVTGWVQKKTEAVKRKAETENREKTRQEKRETAKQEKGETAAKEREGGFSGNEGILILGCCLFFFFGCVITVIPEPHYFTASSAVTDLVNGNAKAYAEVRKERMLQYYSGEKNLVVEPLPEEKPRLLYFSDIKEDPADWENESLCRFYGLDSVQVGK